MTDQPEPGRAAHTLPLALDHLEAIAGKITGKRLAVFLDYDGTLTPTVEHPELAVLAPSMRDAVGALAACCPVAVISGRDRADVHARVGLDDLIYAGSHGFDIAGPLGREIHRREGAEFETLLAQAEASLRRRLEDIEGILIEPKAVSVAVHYRQVADGDVPAVKAAVETILAEHAELRVTPGKKVFEIQPRLDWDKGRAVLWLLESLGLDGEDATPVYLGDDITDEDAFRALKGRGVSILVETPPGGGEEGMRESAADYRLASPDEAERLLGFLRRCCAEGKGKRD